MPAGSTPGRRFRLGCMCVSWGFVRQVRCDQMHVAPTGGPRPAMLEASEARVEPEWIGT